MYLTLIAISFLGSIAFTLFLRRMERPAAKTTHLKRLGELQEQNIENLAGRHLQSIQDAILDYDMLLRQSHTAREDLKEGLKSYQDSIESIHQERAVIDDISRELGEIAGSARTVGEQVERLDRGLERLSYAEEEMTEIQSNLGRLTAEIERRGGESEATLADVVSRLVRETEERTRSLTENARSSFQILQEEYKELETRLDDQSRDMDILTERVTQIGNRFEEKWLGEAGRIEERTGEIERRFSDRLASLEEGLAGMRNKAVESLQGEIKRMRDELEDFNLEGMSRRDEILNETRRMAEGLQDQVRTFQENYLAAENRLLQDAEHYNKQLREKHEVFEKEWLDSQNGLLQEFESRTNELEGQIDGLRNRETEELGDEAERLREDLKQFAGDIRDRIEHQVVQSEEKLREFQRTEERELQNAKEELGQLKDNLNLLSQEMKAGLRSETEHSITLIKDARKSEEEHFARGRSELEGFRKEIQERLEQVEEQFTEVSKIRGKMQSFADDLQNDLGATTDRYRDELGDRLAEIESEQGEIRGEVDKMLQHASAELEKHSAEQLKEVARTRDRVEEFAERVRKEISTARDESIGELEKRATKFITEQDDKLHRLSTEIDEKINRQLMEMSDEGQLQLSELEKRTERAVASSVERVERDIASAEQNFETMRQSIAAEMQQARVIKDEVLREIERDTQRISEFREQLTVVDRADAYITRLDETLEVLSGRLELAQQENSKLDEYVHNFETVRASRKEIESELRLLENQRERMTETEQQLFNVEKQLEELHLKLSGLDRAEELAGKIEKRIVQFNDFKDSFEKYFGEMGERRKFVESAVHHIEASRDQARSASDTAVQLLKKVERVELRHEHMQEGLSDLENRATRLRGLESEIQRVEARFEQMDGLLIDLEEKQKQISVMARRVEELRDGGEETRQELASLVAESEEKMDRLTAFYETVDALVDQANRFDSTDDLLDEKLTPVGGRRGRKAAAQGVPEHKRNGILSLHLNHKWDADLIAERMKIDPSIVRAVIASHNQ
ncbi:MAG: hypothetical protein RIF32_22675 [Leptospirales bacterium]|jgi:chromosome segregation ATPase